jgi:hypothetical protein
MALSEAARLEMAEMLGPNGVDHPPLYLWQSIFYCSGWDTAYIKERFPAEMRVLRLPGSEAKSPAMSLRILP